MKVTISITASEKLSPAQYESLDRSVFISAEIETDDLAKIEDVTRELQMRAEAQMYAALSRGMGDRGQNPAWLRACAMDRANRVSKIASTEEQCAGVPREDRKGVLR